MLPQEEHVEVMALARRGVAHLRHRGTPASTGAPSAPLSTRAGSPVSVGALGPDAFAGYENYVRQRPDDDPHGWATVPYDGVRALGYERTLSALHRRAPAPFVTAGLPGLPERPLHEPRKNP